jgi:hypothetical protein
LTLQQTKNLIVTIFEIDEFSSIFFRLSNPQSISFMVTTIPQYLKRSLLLILFLASISPVVKALDFIDNGQFNPLVKNGYKVQPGDTFWGYPIFAPDNDWFVTYTQMANTSGSADSVKQPIIAFARYEGGKFVIGQTITVTIGTSNGQRWMGEPCGGEKTIKINFVRGGLDRCATAEIQSIRIDGNQTDILSVNFLETNQGGRLYQATIIIHYLNLGFTNLEVTDRSSEFNKRLKDWMGRFLDSVVKAATYEKPINAFAGVPSLSTILNGKSQSAAPITSTDKDSGKNSTNKSLEDRLRRLKELFESKLINEDDYKRKRTEILNAL